jgi:hypothetical protein
MYPEIEKRCQEILNILGENPDPLEIAKLAYITALADAEIIPTKQTPA